MIIHRLDVAEHNRHPPVVPCELPDGIQFVQQQVHLRAGHKDRKIAWWRDYLDPLRVFAALEGRPFEPDGAEANRSAAFLAPSVCVEPGPAGR